MKYFALVVATLAGTASAAVSKPDVSFGVNVGHDTMGGSTGEVVPKIAWQSEETTIAGFDVKGGIDMTVTDIKKTPKTIMWGRVKRDIPDIDGSVSVRGQFDADQRDTVDLDIQASGFGTGLTVTGSADIQYPAVTLDKVQLSKTLEAFGGSLNLNPSYSVSKRTPDATVGYSYGPTSFKVDAQKKQLTVAHSFNGNKISPTVSAGGDFSLSYTRDVADGKLTTTWTPDDSIKVQWTDGGWDATVLAPLEGYYKTNSGIKVSMKRNIDVPL